MKRIYLSALLILLLVSGGLMLGACGEAEPPEGDSVVLTYYLTDENTQPQRLHISKSMPGFYMTAPTREGYAFEGLYDAAVGGVQVVDAQCNLLFVPSSDMTLWVHWTPLTYTAVFDPAEGELISFDGEKSYVYDSAVGTFPVPVREGYDFLGWRCGDVTVSGANGVPQSDCTRFDFTQYTLDDDGQVHLTALWERRRVTVTLDYNDGSNRTQTRLLDYGETLKLSDLPICDDGDRATLGWSYAKDASELVSEDLVGLTENVTLYGVWSKYTSVCFTEADGKTQSVRVFDGVPYTPYIPEREGYAFEGWYVSDAFVGNPVETIHYYDAKDTYYARFELISYTVTYDSNGAIFGETAETLVRSVEQPTPLPEHGFYNGEYIFEGWNTAADGSGIAFADGETVGFIPGAEDGHITLYAQWRLKRYLVTLDYANPSKRPIVEPENCTVTEVTVYMEQPYVLPTPTCRYFKFLGWEIGGVVCKSEDLWTMDAGEDGATVAARAVWGCEVDLTKPLTFECTPEESIRITDESNNQNMYVVTTGLERSMLEAYGYVGFVLTVTVEITEIDDGYQHVLIRNANSESEIVHDLVIEHGPGHKDTSTGTHTVTAVVPVQKLDGDGGLKVTFSAHGNGSDDWLLGKTTYTFTFNQ